ncbi:cytochrome P450 [Trichoderma longibrachiatum]
MLLLSPVVLIGAAALLFVVRLIQRLRSPLGRIPGPAVSRFTSLVLKWKEIKALRTAYIHQLHRKYGPVVRIAPNEVSFTSWEALKEIYCSGGSGYDKTEFYDLFKIYGRRTMFTTLNKADHAKRKRILADRYANSNIMKSASVAGVQERSSKFLRRCVSSPGGVSDIFVTLHAYACDCITHHLFHPFGTDCIGKKEDEEMMHQVAADDSLQSKSSPYRLISHYAPTLHRLFSKVLYLFAKPRETPLADDYVLETSQLSGTAPFTLTSRFDEKTGDLDYIDKAAECLDHMAAGIDTTGDGLCFLMWELSQPRSLAFQRKLTDELRANPETPSDRLPYLDAVVNEGLRCFPPIPMSLPRYVPRGGRSIDGFWLPEKTIVSCQAYSVHRLNSDVFPDGDRFDPDRWLEPKGDADRRRLQFAFSNGGRGCIGKHLALLEMKTLLRDVYSRYSTTPHESMKEEAMVMSDQLISARPVGQKCLLRFHALGDDGKEDET